MDEIRDNRSLVLLRQLKTSLFDCVTNLKSNDETFKICTFPNVRDKFSDLMSQYVDCVQNLEAAQRTFSHLQENVTDDDRDPNGGEPVDLDKLRLLFEQTLQQNLSERVTDEAEAQVMLNALIKPERQAQPAPTDEEIYVEQSTERAIPKDPITKKNIKIAVRSKKCNHIYDQESIKRYIDHKDKNKAKVQCPVAGCSNRNMKKTELVLDDATNAIIASMI